jgi:DNA-binding NtrC family response regulator
MSFEKVLIIEDESVVRNFLTEIFVRRRCAVTAATTLAEAEVAVGRDSFDLVVLDIRLPDGDGQKFLEQLAALPERPLVIVVTGYGSIESAVACMRAGAFDYVMKPFSPSQIDVVLKKAQAYRQLLQVNRLLSGSSDDDDGGLLGKSPAMVRLRQLIERVAPTDATVFISGESGTGKEMIAREIYRRSPRRQQPFIKMNCAAISETLIESEFFGHERGAFTGATERREGRFELANHGTLLLDEVSEIPANLQAKLLRVLQEREFERVGGNRTIKVNVRILATSNRDLLHYVEQGQFRQDLYYRLNVFPVTVPPLRDHPEDIPLLSEYFLRRYARKHGVKVTGFAESASVAMMGYRWPGNVRELQNAIERAVILSENGRSVTSVALGLSAFAAYQPELPFTALQAPTAVAGPKESQEPARVEEGQASPQKVPVTGPGGGVLTIAELERQAIRAALVQTGGNRTQAAACLGISIRTLRNKLQEYREGGNLPELPADLAESAF